MGLAGQVMRLWIDPVGSMRRMLAAPPREDRALAVVMGAGAFVFLGEIPLAMRAAALDPAVPVDARIGGALMGAVFLRPLAAYAVAAASRIVARLLGGHGSWHGARLALFWALLAVQPVALVLALLRARAPIDASAGGLDGLGVAAFGAFLYLWFRLLVAAESRPAAERSPAP
jgi:hypothetical protein